MFQGQDLDYVFDRICCNDGAVTSSVSVRGAKLAIKHYRNSQLFDGMARAVADYLEDADRRFSVAMVRKFHVALVFETAIVMWSLELTRENAPQRCQELNRMSQEEFVRVVG